jgi:hypothetical protein
LVEKYGISAALEATYIFTRRNTPSYVFDELRGLSDATGISYDQIVWMHQFPEVCVVSVRIGRGCDVH